MQDDQLGVILSEYERDKDLYASLTQKATGLINELIEEERIQIHSISSRFKDKDSLRRKIVHSEGKYSKLSDITDISGIRIITYFEDDVNKVAKIIEKEFKIDKDNSVDKRVLLDPDRFGYLSLHYICVFSASRLKLTEYRRLRGCQFEVQIRSILQHAWAEIEHDLGYKTKLSVPKEIRRRFSRLAGLLEIADSEFAQLRDTLNEYERQVFDRINSTPESVSIDLISLKAFISQNMDVKTSDEVIALASGRMFREQEYDLNILIRIFDRVGLATISDINSRIEKHHKSLPLFAEFYIKRLIKGGFKFQGWLRAGTSLMYLCHLIVAEENSQEAVIDYLKSYFNLKPENLTLNAAAIVEAYDKVRSTIPD